MASLIFESARAARQEAERMRVRSLALRLEVRASNRLAHARMEKAMAAAVARDDLRRDMVYTSPWSGLEWHRDDEQLSRVLVPLD